MPEPTNNTNTADESRGMTGVPPVSGSMLAEAEVVELALIIALALEVELAEAEELLVLVALAEAEELDIALAEAEALEVGLAIILSSIPRSSIPISSACPESIPLSSMPISPDWAAATGAKTNTASATDNTNTTNLRIATPRLWVRYFYIRWWVAGGSFVQ
jgi:hypothetical protein